MTDPSLKNFYGEITKGERVDFEGLTHPVAPDFLAILDHANLSGRGLDIGYGFGAYTIAMAEKGLEVDAVDLIDPAIIKARVGKTAISALIHPVEMDIRDYTPTKPFDVVVAKDVLHFLPEATVRTLLSMLVERAPMKSLHYLVIFSDITRTNQNGEQIILGDEARFSAIELSKLVHDIHKGWTVQETSSPYSEPSYNPMIVEPYFSALKNTYICENNNA
jgi:2-polyprenyl-3-methyl-5-hydroxy-6-metoxy-1,4-benzoquinol methylase